MQPGVEIVPGMFALIRLNSSVSIHITIHSIEQLAQEKYAVLVQMSFLADEEEMDLLEGLDIRDETLTLTNTIS